jgi:hypothetical protein
MEETTSRTLVVIIVATLFIALFGSVATMNKFGGFSGLTGAWGGPASTVYGSANLTIESNLEINFSDDVANFGTGYICSGYDSATIGTDGTNTTSSNCGWSLPNGLILENVGNKKAAIIITNTNYSNSLLGGTKSGYAWKWETPETAGAANKNVTCSSGSNATLISAFGAFVNITTVYDGNSTLCDMFNFTDASDKINISFKFHIDQTALARTVTDTWKVVAADAGQ